MNAVIITKRKRAELADLGQRRNAAKLPELTRRQSDVFTDTEVDVLGMYGEYTTGFYLGVGIDESIGPGGDKGVDHIWRGYSIATKFNHRWGGYLIVEERDGDDPANGIMCDLTCDIIILTHGRCDPTRQICHCRREGGIYVAVAGWLRRHEFIDKMAFKNWGLGGRYVCQCNQLRSMHTIWDECPAPKPTADQPS